MRSKQKIDVKELIDQQPLNRFLVLLVGMSFLAIIMDGFDISVMGLIAPQLRVNWGLSHDALGTILTAALVGQAVGAISGGSLADWFGRRPVMLGSVFCIGICTLATAFSTDVPTMVVSRFLTGLGLGAIIPSTSTLISEYAPKRMHSILVTITLCGFTVGAAGGGFLAAWMLPAFGWHSILLVGGIFPIVLGTVLLFMLPESLRFLLTRKSPRAERAIQRVLSSIDPDCSADAYELYASDSLRGRAGAIATVLAPRYRSGTALLCFGYFCVLFLIFLFNSWLPTLIKEGGGYSLSQSAVATAMFQLGGPIGSIVIGWLMDRWRANLVLAFDFLIAGCAAGAIGQVSEHFQLICALTFVVGFCMGGGSVGMTAFCAAYYPTTARATGTSWMLGIGRLGAVLSAITGAAMLTLGWSLPRIFLALVVPALVAAAVMLVMTRFSSTSEESSHGGESAEVTV
jgi:MFS transporter, AAHS family, 4-hydroxybenzoate transporter